MVWSVHRVFVASLVVTLALQSVVWLQVDTFVDHEKWTERINNLVADTSDGRWHLSIGSYNERTLRYSGHPGTTILSAGALLQYAGVPPERSLMAAVIILNGLIMAAVVAVCYFVRPRSYWWLLVAVIVPAHYLFVHVSPTNAVNAPLMLLLFLLTLTLYEHHSDVPRWALVLFGVAFGLGLSTRLYPTAFTGIAVLYFLSFYIGWRRVVGLAVLGVVVALATNPLFWFAPFDAVRTILVLSSSHYVYGDGSDNRLLPLHFAFYAPFAVLGLVLITVTTIFQKRFEKAAGGERSFLPILPIQYVLLLVLTTVTMTALFLSAQFQTMRYLFPLILTWDVLFALWLLDAAQYVVPSVARSPRAQRAWAVIIPGAVTFILLFGYAVLLYYNAGLWGPRGLI